MSENDFKSIDSDKKTNFCWIPVFQNRETIAETCAQVLDDRKESFPHLEPKLYLLMIALEMVHGMNCCVFKWRCQFS